MSFYKQDSCGCYWLLHLVTQVPVTVIKWCGTHRPMFSLTGKKKGDE